MSDRPIGMIGFSLGGLDVINAAARDKAASLFDAGTIAVSPPAAIPTIRATLDDVATPMGLYFRSTLRLRNRRLGIPFWTRQPFKAYLDHIAATEVPQFGNADRLMEAAEPATHMRDVRRPLLVLAARNDPVLSQIAADALAKAAQSLPYVHVIETDEGGHVGIIGRDPQWFVNAINTFFDHAKDVSPRP
ncbi:MAG: alpha/beta fold hydrolase, partial [Terriglobia bacterium]